MIFHTQQLFHKQESEIGQTLFLIRGYLVAAIDIAAAAETTADGKKRTATKEAEGVRQARIFK